MKHLLLLVLAIVITFALTSCNKDDVKTTDEKKDTTETSNTTKDMSDDKSDIKETTSFDTTNLAAVQNALRTILKGDMKDLTENDKKFTYSHIDLNGDGAPETLVMMQGSYFCGSGGCTVYLMDENYKEISNFSVSDEPIKIAETSSNGWSDLLITSDGKLHTMKSNGKKYPMNPSVEPEYTGDGKQVTEVKFSPPYSF